MLLTIAGVAVLSYALVFCVAVLLVRAVMPNDRNLRLAFIKLAAVLPPLLVWALALTFLRRTARPPQYFTELSEVEDEIETDRIKVFGGHKLEPSIAGSWKIRYVRYLVGGASRLSLSFSNNIRPLRTRWETSTGEPVVQS